MYDRLKDHNNPSTSAPETTGQNTEQITEQTTEQSGETVAEQNKPNESQAQTTEAQSSQESKTFDVGGVNDFLGSSFKDEQELKSLYEKQPLLSEYETKLAEREKAIQDRDAKYNALLDSVDPEKLIPDKEMFAVTQLKDKYPGVDPQILSKIRGADLATMDKLEALVVLDKLAVSSNVSDSIRKEEILKGLGIEDSEELTENDRYKIEREYAKQSQVLNEIKEFQPDFTGLPIIGESKERKEQRAQQMAELKTRNETALRSIMTAYDKTTSPYKKDGKDLAFEFVVPQEWKDANLPDIVQALTNNGYDVEKNIEEVKKQIDAEFWLQNRYNIVNDIYKQASTQEKVAAHNEIHSDTEQNTTEAPPTKGAAPKTLRESIKSGGFKKVIRNY